MRRICRRELRGGRSALRVRLRADEPWPLVANGEAVCPENDADQQQPPEEPIEWVRNQRVPLVGIPEASNSVQCELSYYLFSFFRVPQPLAIDYDLANTPPQRDEIEDDK